MGANLTTTDAILKNRYEGPLGDLINKSHPLLERLKPTTEEWEGRKLVYAVDVRRNLSARAMADNGYLPVAGSVTTANAEVNAKKVAGRMEITGELIDASATNKGAFVAGLQHELDGLQESCEDTLHRTLYGNKVSISGDYPTGVITQINGGATNVTQTVDDNRWLLVGRTYIIGTASEIAGGTADVRTVASKSGTTSVTFTSSVTAADNDIICEGDTLDYAYGREPAGLEFMVDNQDDNYLALDTGDYPEWAASVLSNSGTARPLTLDLMHLLYDTITDTSGKEPDFLLMHRSMRRQYVKLLEQDVRFDAGKLGGGWSMLTYSNGSKPVDVFVDQKCTYGTVYMLNVASMNLAVRSPWKFMSRDGAVLNRILNKDAYEASFTWSGNLATRNRSRQGKIKDLTYSLTGV